MDVPSTTTQLLSALTTGWDNMAWQEFDRRYRPLLFAIARRRGMSDVEAADVTQEALLRFIQEFRDGNYRRDRGRLRAFLIAILRGRMADAHRRMARVAATRGDSAFDSVEGTDELDALWDEELRRVVLERAMGELSQTGVEPRSLNAFRQYALDGLPPHLVAENLGMTVEQVYVAKSRVASRLRSIIERLYAGYEEQAAWSV